MEYGKSKIHTIANFTFSNNIFFKYKKILSSNRNMKNARQNLVQHINIWIH